MNKPEPQFVDSFFTSRLLRNTAPLLPICPKTTGKTTLPWTLRLLKKQKTLDFCNTNIGFITRLQKS